MSRALTVAKVALIGVALLAGCSGDDAGPVPETAEVPGADSDESADGDLRTEAERTVDEAAAGSMVLTLADLQPGWESTPADQDNPDDERFGQHLADCLGVELSTLKPNNPKASSPVFESPDDQQVSSEVTFMATPDDAIRALELRRQEGANECYAATLKAAMLDAAMNPEAGEEPPDGLKMGEPTVNEMSFGSLGDDSVAFRMTVPMSMEGLDVEIYLDVVNVRVGRVGVTTMFQSFFTPFDIEEAARLTGIVVDRVEAGAA